MIRIWLRSRIRCRYIAAILFCFPFPHPDAYTDRWISSTQKAVGMGAFVLSSGKFFGDVEKDKGLQTSQDARFYGISTKFESFSNEGSSLVIQFQVKHEQNIDCGGGYVKIFGSDLDQKSMHGDTPYHVMFGPDICGSTKRVHVIFTYKGTNHLVKKEISCKDDAMTHLYTLIVNPDNTYEVRIDGEKAQSGSLEEDWNMLPEKEILDPKGSGRVVSWRNTLSLSYTLTTLCLSFVHLFLALLFILASLVGICFSISLSLCFFRFSVACTLL